jgi:hypothetical protein
LINSKLDINRATNHILPAQTTDEILHEPTRADHLEIQGWKIEIVGDAMFISSPGAMTVTTQVGQRDASLQLGHHRVVIRRDPPPANSRATELVSKDVCTPGYRQGQGSGV